jgi:hypothetical protein
MQIREYRNFQIYIHPKNKGFYAEIIRKDKLFHTVKDPNNPGGLYDSSPLALEAAKEWIDRTYPRGKARYLGEVE